jgi:hypothetical protein
MAVCIQSKKGISTKGISAKCNLGKFEEKRYATAQTRSQAPAGWNSPTNNRGKLNYRSELNAFPGGNFLPLGGAMSSPVAKVTMSVNPIVRQSDGGREGGLLFNQLTGFTLGYILAPRLSPPGSLEAQMANDLASGAQAREIDQCHFSLTTRIRLPLLRRPNRNPKKCTVIGKWRPALFRQIIFGGHEALKANQHQH